MLAALAAAFTAYFCMYAVRKPFTAATWAGYDDVLGLDFKIALVLAQLIGYTASKFIGVRVVSAWPRARRTWLLAVLLACAELSLLAFAIVPGSLKPLCMLANGLPLGMVWGLVFSYLEGRRSSELLGAGLSTSYIVASGAVKSIGASLIQAGVDPQWMPFTTGAIFAVPFAIALLVLERTPPPTEEDQSHRVRRIEMDGPARRRFFWSHALGLTLLTAFYAALTGYRDFRDNFQRDIFAELGILDAQALVTTEILVAFTVLAMLAGVVLIRDNKRAFLWMHAMMLLGTALVGLATLAHMGELIGGLAWMTLVGVGVYLAYVPYGCALFDRFIAASGIAGTAVFMIYITDAFGYVGALTVLLVKNFAAPRLAWVEFFTQFSLATSAAGVLCFALSAWYFATRLPTPTFERSPQMATPDT